MRNDDGCQSTLPLDYPSAVRRPPSAVRRLPSAVRRLPSAARRPPVLLPQDARSHYYSIMLRGRSLRIAGVPVLALTLFSACYRYVPATTSDLVVGGAYRGHLTPEGSQRVAPLVGENVATFDGRVVTVTDTAYLIAMSATFKRTDARTTVWTGEQLVIPRAAVNRFELRELDRARTVRAAALYSAGILALGVLIFSIKSLASGSGSVTPQPPPP